MKKNVVLIAIIGGVIITSYPFWLKRLDSYVHSRTELILGKQYVDPECEAQIMQIAQKMGIDASFFIRKMNYRATSLYGYFNSFVYWPAFMCIPIGDPFLFISPGFFAELSQEEQCFLIGHELIHLKESHTRYLGILYVITSLIFLLALYFLRRYSLVRWKAKTSSTTIIVLLISLFFSHFIIRNFLTLAYRRHIEWVADDRCLRVLREFDGCCKFMDRYQTIFKLPDVHSYYGIFADHPSCRERKEYCLKLFQELKDVQ